MRVPKNKIKENQYTSGNEFVEKESFRPYKGYYYIIDGNKYYSGKTFDLKAIELTKNSPQTAKVKSFTGNSLKYFLLAATPAVKGVMSKPSNVSGINSNIAIDTTGENKTTNRFFIKKSNENPILIKEVNEETYNNTTDPIYIKATLSWNTQTGFNSGEVDALDKTSMSGIKAFVG